MRKIYDEYLHVPEQGKGIVREKVFLVRIAISVICMILCMFAMGYNAFAYFTTNVESSANVLKATTYSFDRTADSIQVISAEGSVSAIAGEEGKYKLAAGTYDFLLTKVGTATTGYGKIDIFDTAGNVAKTFYTKQIGVVDAEGNEVDSRTIRIQVAKETIVQIVACWGTYINPDENLAFDENEKMVLVDSEQNAKIDAKVNPTTTESLSADSPTTVSAEPATTEVTETEPTVADSATTEPTKTEE